jgi:hypothetical protein
VRYRFTGGSDGWYPETEVAFDKAGNLYGTTFFGGVGRCQYNGGPTCGVVYELNPSSGGWTESVLYRFTGGNDGGEPSSGLVLDQSGNLYSTTTYGDDPGCNYG